KVVLSAKEQDELRKRRKQNIRRIKDGLNEYNEEKNTSYKISEDRIQGSMAMHTITQNDEKDYDIDVGIVFEADCLNSLGAQA
ncbi:cyclic GMP-AMP synthase DncV-like nucleotidyltransferase, partial [Clostridium sp. ZBS14]